MSTTARLEQTSVQLTAGSVETIPLQIRNDSDIVEGYRFEVLGAPSAWTTIEPAEITGLYPGTETTATVSFRPPRSSDVPVGELSFGVRVIPTEQPENVVVPEGMIDVLPFLETTAELVPRTTSGRRGATHRLAIDNRGNVPVSVQLHGAQPSGTLDIDPRPPLLTVAPGQAAFTDVRVSPIERFWRGPNVTHPFTITASAEGTTPVVLDGTHVQEARMASWLPKLLLALLLLALLLVALWFLLLRPAIVSTAQAAVEEPVAEANERAAEASEQAQQAQQAAQSAQGAAVEAGEAAVEATDLVGSPTLEDLVVPVADRFQANTPAGLTSTRSIDVPTSSTMKLTDFVISNPQGDFGRVEVQFGDRTLFDMALENFRNVDYHFQAPIVGGEGTTLRMTVRCDEVGQPPAQVPEPTACDTAVFYGGTLLRPVSP